MSSEHKRSWAWYLFPVFFNIFGGLFAYYAIRPDDPKKARECLNIGITLTAITVGVLLAGAAITAITLDEIDSVVSGIGNDLDMSDYVAECLRQSAGIDNTIESVDVDAFAWCLESRYVGVFAP